jgi:hypothetical protein
MIEQFRELLSYDPETGVFSWLVTRRFRAGTIAGSISWNGYRFIAISGRRFPAHRLAWLFVNGRWPIGQIDHVNGCRDDNRITNLREASWSQNQANSRKHRDSKSPYKGVRPHGEKWASNICVDGCRQYLGLFDTAEEAHARYCEAAQDCFGEFWRG